MSAGLESLPTPGLMGIPPQVLTAQAVVGVFYEREGIIPPSGWCCLGDACSTWYIRTVHMQELSSRNLGEGRGHSCENVCAKQGEK